MRWIDYKLRKPTDTDLPGWKPWTQAEWDSWLTESTRLHGEVKKLDDLAREFAAAGKSKEAEAKCAERNQFIDDHADHWGELKAWLLALSHGKCWFTEGREICSHFEVEHFRPKKVAKNFDKSQRDGYWWLAFEYGNYRIAGNVPNRKKGGWFPLHINSPCSKVEARCEESETQYLLDPVCQEDTILIAFDEEGNAIPAPEICYRLLLLPGLQSVAELPASQKLSIVIAEIQNQVHIRVFDEQAKIVLDAGEAAYSGQQKEFALLLGMLKPFWSAPTAISKSDSISILDQISVLTKRSFRTWDEERVNVSVDRLKLNEHDALPSARRLVWQAMTKAIERFLDAKSKYRPGINPAPRATMQENARQIREMTRPEAELSSVALWCLRFRNDPQLMRLAT